MLKGHKIINKKGCSSRYTVCIKNPYLYLSAYMWPKLDCILYLSIPVKPSRCPTKKLLGVFSPHNVSGGFEPPWLGQLLILMGVVEHTSLAIISLLDLQTNMGHKH